MKNWINSMNNMLAENPYTTGRVTIDYCENANVIIIIAFGNNVTIKADNYTDYGLMMKCMEVIDALYNKAQDIFDYFTHAKLYHTKR